METIKLTVTPDIERVLRKKLEAIRAIHLKELTAHMKLAGNMSPLMGNKFNERLDELRERGKRITINNLLRASLIAGVWKVSETDALDFMAAEGIPMGRPIRAAQGE